MKIINWIIIISLLGNLCYAEDTVYLEKNKPAPFDGFLFTETKARDIRFKLLERDNYSDINESLTKTNKYLQENSGSKDKQIQIIMDRNDQLSKSLRDSQSTSNWERIFYFGLGVLATSFSLYAIKKVAQF